VRIGHESVVSAVNSTQTHTLSWSDQPTRIAHMLQPTRNILK